MADVKKDVLVGLDLHGNELTNAKLSNSILLDFAEDAQVQTGAMKFVKVDDQPDQPVLQIYNGTEWKDYSHPLYYATAAKLGGFFSAEQFDLYTVVNNDHGDGPAVYISATDAADGNLNKATGVFQNKPTLLLQDGSLYTGDFLKVGAVEGGFAIKWLENVGVEGVIVNTTSKPGEAFINSGKKAYPAGAVYVDSEGKAFVSGINSSTSTKVATYTDLGEVKIKPNTGLAVATNTGELSIVVDNEKGLKAELLDGSQSGILVVQIDKTHAINFSEDGQIRLELAKRGDWSTGALEFRDEEDGVNKLGIRLEPEKGLEETTEGLAVVINTDTGLAFSTDGNGKIQIKLDDADETGLYFNGNNNYSISIRHAGEDTFGVVKIGDNIDVEDGVISIKEASVTDLGVIQLATLDEMKAGTDTKKAVTPEGLDLKVDFEDIIFDPTTGDWDEHAATYFSKEIDGEHAEKKIIIKANIATDLNDLEVAKNTIPSSKAVVDFITDKINPDTFYAGQIFITREEGNVTVHLTGQLNGQHVDQDLTAKTEAEVKTLFKDKKNNGALYRLTVTGATEEETEGIEWAGYNWLSNDCLLIHTDGTSTDLIKLDHTERTDQVYLDVAQTLTNKTFGSDNKIDSGTTFTNLGKIDGSNGLGEITGHKIDALQNNVSNIRTNNLADDVLVNSEYAGDIATLSDEQLISAKFFADKYNGSRKIVTSDNATFSEGVATWTINCHDMAEHGKFADITVYDPEGKEVIVNITRNSADGGDSVIFVIKWNADTEMDIHNYTAVIKA